jgi:hypothetical protein
MSDDLEPEEEPIGETPDTDPQDDGPSQEELDAAKALQDEARKFGWKPKEEYTKPPAGWMEPTRFLEHPSTKVKMLRDEKRAWEQERQELSQRLAGIERATADTVKRARDQERQQYESRLAEVQRQQREAVETADSERFENLRRHEDRLRATAPAPQPEVNPEVAAYREKNPWVSDPEVGAYAYHLIEANPAVKTLTFANQMKFVEKNVREMFPDRFPILREADIPRQRPDPTHSKVDGGGLAGSRRSLADKLPAEARAAGSRFVKQGLYSSLDEYAKVYLGE